MNELIPTTLDDETVALYLEIPGSRVVLLQAYFELYEELGTVRTIDIKNSLVCIITTNSMMTACCELLKAIRSEIDWRSIPQPKCVAEDGFIGYKNKDYNL